MCYFIADKQHGLLMSDSTHTIFQSARRFFSGTILSRITGMIRDMSMAYVFGTQVSVASFMLAFRFAHLMRRLFGEGALQSAFIPEFEALRHGSPERAFLFFRDLKVLLILFLSLLILVGCTCLGAGLSYGHLEPDNQEVVYLTLLMLPSLLFICLYGLNASLLQCEKNYFTASFAPVGFNVVQICTIITLYYSSPSQPMHWLAGGVILACLFQWLITLPKIISILKKNLTDHFWERLNPFSSNVLNLIKPLTLGIVGIAASQINNAIDALFGRLAEAEGPAFLWYSMRLQQLPLAIFGIAVSAAVLPPLSRAIKALDFAKYHHFIDYALQKTIFLMLPITFFILASGDTSVNLVYGRGDFHSGSIAGTTLCLWAYGLGLIPSALILIMAPACYAQGNYRSPAIASFIAMGLNTFLNAWMILWLGLGSVSVAFATSVSAWMNLIFLSRSLSSANGPLWTSNLIEYTGKVGLATGIAFLGVTTARAAIPDLMFPTLLAGQIPSFPNSFLMQLFNFIWQGSCFGLLFALAAFGLGLFSSLPVKQNKLENPENVF